MSHHPNLGLCPRTPRTVLAGTPSPRSGPRAARCARRGRYRGSITAAEASSRTHRAVRILLIAVLLGTAGASAQNPLIEAVKEGNLEAVRARLRDGADVAVPELDGTTALHWAVHRDDHELAELLIDAGADVTATNRYGVAPLSLACTNGSARMIERLLIAGADSNGSLPEGETALMTAARTGRVEAVTLLLDHGAAVNAAEEWRGQTALMWAAAEGHAAVVRTLIERGAALEVRPGRPAPLQAEGFTAFLFAVRGGHLDTARVLADAGADVEQAAPDGSSALVVAVDNRNYEVAAWLLERGADPNTDDVGWAALHTAVVSHRPHFRVVPHPDPTGSLDSVGVIKALLEHGANPNAHATKRLRLSEQSAPLFERLGITPFMLAAVAADVPVMRLMLEHGADPHVTTPVGSTALMAAAGAATYQWQSPGTQEEALEAVKLLVELGVDVNQADEAGNTALHGAANRGAHLIIEYLLAKGAKLDAANKEGWMPVTIAQGPHGLIEPYPETYAFLLGLMEEAGLSAPECPRCAIGYDFNTLK